MINRITRIILYALLFMLDSRVNNKDGDHPKNKATSNPDSKLFQVLTTKINNVIIACTIIHLYFTPKDRVV